MITEALIWIMLLPFKLFIWAMVLAPVLLPLYLIATFIANIMANKHTTPIKRRTR